MAAIAAEVGAVWSLSAPVTVLSPAAPRFPVAP
jgi:hypothetical protein